MLVRFQINYWTQFGQHLLIVGSIPSLGSGKTDKAGVMNMVNIKTGRWEFHMELDTPADFTYRYFVRDSNTNTLIEEWGPDRVFNYDKRIKQSIAIYDCWRPLSDPDFTLNSSAFVNAIFKVENVIKTSKVSSKKVENSVIVKFKPNIVRVTQDYYVAVCGSAKNLGLWKDKDSVSLGNVDFPLWKGEVAIDITEFPLHYKYLIQNKKGVTEFWEKTTDRVVELPEGAIPECIEIGDEKFEFPLSPWKGVGVAIPVFSLRREQGFGVGEFTDLKLLVDWASKAGIRMIQTLPVNDTVARHTWQDSYPYAAISVYAMHPIYINLLEIGKLKAEINQQIIECQGAYLNSLTKIDYEAVMVLKSRFFKLIYDETKEDFFADPEFQSFYSNNEFWLRPYAAFSYLRDLFNTADFSRWGEYSKPSPELLNLLTDKNSTHFDEIAVHYFIQYHAHRQLIEAAEYARSKGVVLKGDIPIGIYRNSVDAWLNPQLYHMDCQAGAPPDDFSAKGQNWRFPTYNWEEMAKDNYAWWQQRLRQLSLYFDAFRIDHILGFFRIWEIPASQVEGLMGYFNPSIPYYRDELQNRGVWFDDKRFAQPYIREHFLYNIFGDQTEFVKANFLLEYAPGCFDLHPDYNTQRKVEEKLAVEPDASPELRNRNEKIILGLYALISDVIFLVAPGTGGNAFFPRNALHFTHSYQELDEQTKHRLNELYLDYFYKRNESFWREKAMTKLPVIKKATNMLLCGEDLGMVPACVPDVMKDLGILSLEVQRMPKDPKISFGNTYNYPYLSVATPSSHDTSTIRGWWEENREQIQRYYNEVLGFYGAAPAECTSEIVSKIIEQHLQSPSMWAVFPLQDLLGMDENLRLKDPNAERINQPGNPNHYWRYRIHISLEELLKQTEFNKVIFDKAQNSGRI